MVGSVLSLMIYPLCPAVRLTRAGLREHTTGSTPVHDRKTTLEKGTKMTIARSGRGLAAALCVSACALPALAAPPAASPFAKVPPLPTGCYSSQDQWNAKSEEAFDAIQAANYAQDEINSGISQAANEAFSADPMAVANAMTQKMMEDPANAQKYMEQMAAQSQQAQTAVPEQHAKEEQFKKDAQALKKQYETALTSAMGAANARFAAVKKRYDGMDGSDLMLRYGDPGEPAWLHPERMAILRERDQGYAANCPAWFGATGKVQAFLKRYKDYLVNERIPFQTQFDEAALNNYRSIGVDYAAWRTTTDYDAAKDYIRMAQDLYQMREEKPRCNAEFTCQ